MPIAVESLDHVTVNITNVERAKKFYGGLLGLEEIERPDSFTFPGAWYRAGTSLIHLVGKDQPDPLSTRHFCLWVSDVRSAYETIETAGFEVKWDARKIPGIDRFFTRDPDGNRVEFQGSDGTVWQA